MRVHLPDDLTEDEAFGILWQLRDRFGWAGCTPTTFSDAESVLGRELTNTEREAITNERLWSSYIRDRQAEVANDVVVDVLDLLDISGPDYPTDWPECHTDPGNVTDLGTVEVTTNDR